MRQALGESRFRRPPVGAPAALVARSEGTQTAVFAVQHAGAPAGRNGKPASRCSGQVRLLRRSNGAPGKAPIIRRPHGRPPDSHWLPSHEISTFLAEVERRAFKQAMFAVRDEDTALDIVQDAMLKLTEKYADKPAGGAAAAVPADPAEHDPRPFPAPEGPIDVDDAAVGARGKGDEKDDDYDPLETLRQNPTPTRRRTRADSSSNGRLSALIEQALAQASGASTRGVSAALLGGVRRGGNRGGDGLLGGQREDPLLARGACPGRDAGGQRGEAMSHRVTDMNSAKKTNDLPRPGQLRTCGPASPIGCSRRGRPRWPAPPARRSRPTCTCCRPRMRWPAGGAGSQGAGERPLYGQPRLWLGDRACWSPACSATSSGPPSRSCRNSRIWTRRS